MARFPRTEPKIAALAKVLADGLAREVVEFPAPPYSPAEIEARLVAYAEATAAITVAESAVRERRAEKNEALAQLVDAMKSDIRYAEYTARKDPNKLGLLGWGARRRRRSLQAPGQVLGLRITFEGETWIGLDWKPPAEGGAAVAYSVQRRVGTDGAWTDVASAVKTEARLEDQPRRVELEYRVIAVNRAGSGGPSATVRAVL